MDQDTQFKIDRLQANLDKAILERDHYQRECREARLCEDATNAVVEGPSGIARALRSATRVANHHDRQISELFEQVSELRSLVKGMVKADKAKPRAKRKAGE